MGTSHAAGLKLPYPLHLLDNQDVEDENKQRNTHEHQHFRDPSPDGPYGGCSALDSFTQENFQRSVLEFEEFVVNHPDHDLADNAQYWIGECYYAQKNFEQAVIEFGRVGKYYSAGNKAPAALLKKGLALKELGRDQEARGVLEDVIGKYPASDEAEVSGKRLSQWR